MTADINDRDGVGKNESRTLGDALGDLNGFRTRIHKEAGREVMLRTKGGMPEVTEKREVKQAICIKGPLTEIAFKYVNPTAVTGYRRWYGEPDPALGAATKTIKYERSSDLLFCMEARKLQKICFKDANGQNVDFLFAERPEDDTIPADALPAVDATAAGSTARFKFKEGKYPEREWYPSEVANIGWAFAGPQIDGEPDPEPAACVKFFIKRVRSIMFTISDTLGKIVSSRVKWIFAGPGYTDRTLGATTSACTNQSARELSFTGRHFFADTEGNMDKLTMSVGIDEPPAVAAGPSFVVNFQKPGSFVAAIDPEGAVGNTRPADVSQAIDMCAFSSFGNPYHGLVWWPVAGSPVLYTDVTRTAQWGFTPSMPPVPLMSSLFGTLLDHRYYNVTGVDPLLPENQIKGAAASDGVLMKDAFFAYGCWAIKDDVVGGGWGQLRYDEFLYRDDAGTVWVCQAAITYSNIAGGVRETTITVWVNRRFGVLGTEFSAYRGNEHTVRRALGVYVVNTPEGWDYYGTRFAESMTVAPDARQVLITVRQIASGEVVNAAVIALSGAGATVADPEHGVVVSAGIASGFALFPVATWRYETVDDTRTGYYPGYETDVPFNVFSLMIAKAVDIYWVDGQWKELTFTEHMQCTSFTSTTGGIDETFMRTVRLCLNGDVLSQLNLARTRHVDWSPAVETAWSGSGTTSGWEAYAASSTNTHGYHMFTPKRVNYYPAVQGYNGEYWYTPYQQYSPVAWALYMENPPVANLVAPTELVYKDKKVAISQNDVSVWIDGSSNRISALIGWAYDYRANALITVPYGTLAYFV